MANTALRQQSLRRAGLSLSPADIARAKLDAARAKLDRCTDALDLQDLIQKFDRPECTLEVTGRIQKRA